MNHSFSKTKFSEGQLRNILKIKDLLTCNKLPEILLKDIYLITTAHDNIKDMSLVERVKIEKAHDKYCKPIPDKRMTKIRLFNDNAFVKYQKDVGHGEIR